MTTSIQELNNVEDQLQQLELTDSAVATPEFSVETIKNIILTSQLTLEMSNKIFKSNLKAEYITLFLMFLNSIEIHATTKTIFLASCFDQKLYPLARQLLATQKFTFIEVLKCLKIMDSKRTIIKYKKRLETIQTKYNERKERVKKLSDELNAQKKKDEDKNNNNNDSTTPKKVEQPKKKESPKKDNDKVNNNNNNKNNKKVDKKKKTKKQQQVKEKTEEQKKKIKREETFEKRYNMNVNFLNTEITRLENIGYGSSLSGNCCRIFKNWFKSIPRDTFEFFALGQPLETLQEIAKMLHLSPSDFGDMPWFLEYMFGKTKAPEGTSVHAFSKLNGGTTATTESTSDNSLEVKSTSEDYLKLIEEYKPAYSFIRKNVPKEFVNEKMKITIAKYEQLSTLIWWIHELGSDQVHTLISDRIDAGEKVDLSIGVLVEKLLSVGNDKESRIFKSLLKITVDKINVKKFSLPPPVAIFGDCSSSMDVAIRMSTIVAYLISNTSTSSHLSFFHSEVLEAPISATSIKEVFELNNLVKSQGCTNPSACLLPFYEEKQVLKYIVVVTDQEENEKSKGFSFAQLWEAYKREVAPNCKIIFVSFLSNHQDTPGQMIREIKKKTTEEEPLNFVLSKTKPDATKVDTMLTMLASESPFFKIQYELLVEFQNIFGLINLLEYTKNKEYFTHSLTLNIVFDIITNLCRNYIVLADKVESSTNFFKINNFKSKEPNQQLEECYDMITGKIDRLLTICTDSGYDKEYVLIEEAKTSFGALEKIDSVKFMLNIVSDLISKFDPTPNIKNDYTIDIPFGELKSKIIQGRLSLDEVRQLLSNPKVKDSYITLFIVLLNSIELPSKLKINTLCIAFELKMFSFAQLILYNKKFGFKEVSKAIEILDSNRSIRVLEQKIENAKKKHAERQERLDAATRAYQESKGIKVKTVVVNEDVKNDPNNNNSNKKKNRANKNRKNKKVKKELTEEQKKKKEREALLKKRYASGMRVMESKLESLKCIGFKGSLSGNISKYFRKWLKSFPEKTLEFFALGQPKEIWKKMADVLHLSPKDFQADWFLPVIFGQDAPEGTSIREFTPDDLPIEKLTELISKFRPSYSYIRKRIQPEKIPDDLKLIIVGYEDLNTVLWWYHELATFNVDMLISQRLKTESISELSYGVLIEKAMYFQKQGIPIFKDLVPIISDNIKRFTSKLSLPPPLATLGDASASMDVAIRLSTIIGSMVTSLTPNASLRFFNDAPIWAPIDINSFSDVFNVSNIIKGSGTTSPSAGLYPIYSNKEKLKYLVVVTDEEENQPYKGFNFTQLYSKYIKEVIGDEEQCKIVFVSFLDQTETGRMSTDLKEQLDITPLQFKLDKNRPDVKKIDDMITILSCESKGFDDQISSLKLIYKLFGEKFFYNYIGNHNENLFLESYTMKNYVFIIDSLLQYRDGTLDTSKFDKKALEKLEQLNGTQIIENTFNSFIKAVDTSLLTNLQGLLNEIHGFPGEQYEVEMIEEIIKSIKEKPEFYYQKQSVVDKNLDQLNNQCTEVARKVYSRQDGHILNDYELSVLFGYIKDIGTLRNCSSVCKLWRKCSLNPNLWAKFIGANDIHNLDLVFCVDDTGSMSGEINEVKEKIKEIVKDIKDIGVNCRVAMTFYNDHDGSETNPVVTNFDFTEDVEEMKKNLATIRAHDGGDVPEALADGLHAITQFSFAPGSTRVCILIGDAPPHGFSGSGDRHPNGCPCGHDPIKLARSLATNFKVTFYTVCCRHDLENKQVFNAIAAVSEGKCVQLANASQLSEFIVGSAKESIFLDSISSTVIMEIESIQKAMPLISIEEAIYRAAYSLKKQNIMVPLPSRSLVDETEKGDIYVSFINSPDYNTFIGMKQKIPKSTTKSKKSSRETTTTETNTSKTHEPLSIEHVKKICKKYKLYL
eukprot:gene4295-5370_t